MSKEKILEEFGEKLKDIEIKDRDGVKLMLLASKIINQTREETIREVEEGICELESGLQGHQAYTAIERINQVLNKLKK
jgi:hypothetical protein